MKRKRTALFAVPVSGGTVRVTSIGVSEETAMPTSCITVRRNSQDGVYSYHVAEAHPSGQVDKVILWRTLDGYFGEITFQNERPSISFDGYNNWSLLKNDLMICLHEELQCPEFDEGSRLRPPLPRRFQDFR